MAQSYEKAAKYWREACLENRLRYVTSAENLSYRIQGKEDSRPFAFSPLSSLDREWGWMSLCFMTTNLPVLFLFTTWVDTSARLARTERLFPKVHLLLTNTCGHDIIPNQVFDTTPIQAKSQQQLLLLQQQPKSNPESL
jgi:hypothetical protein